MAVLLPEWQNRPVKTLMFDLGGVLYAIDIARTIEAFQQLLPADGQFPDQSRILAHPIFRQFEVGRLTPDAFRMQLRESFHLTGSDAQLRPDSNSTPVAGPEGRFTSNGSLVMGPDLNPMMRSDWLSTRTTLR